MLSFCLDLFDFFLFFDGADADGFVDWCLLFFFPVFFCECEMDLFEDDVDADAPIATADATFFAAVEDLFDNRDADVTFFDADADAEGLFAANPTWLVAGIFLL